MSQTSLSRTARAAAGVIALAGLATVVAQIGISSARDGTGLALTFAHMMRFFTLWTNLVGALVFASIAWGKVHSSRVMLALAAAYVVVAVVYHLLLSATHHPVGGDWWTNIMFHTLLPLGAVLWWFAFAPAPRWACVPHVVWAPILYTGFALVVGATTGFYPYFFLDQPKLGWAMLGAWLVGLAAFFLIVALCLKGLRTLIFRGRTVAPA